MAKIPNIITALPHYWNRIHERVNIKWKCKKANLGLARTDINIHDTGVNGKAYLLMEEIADNGDVPLFILPISHVAMNLTKENLIILGPAFKTRDDVYLFRRRKIDTSDKIFKIGIRENDLTTTNMSKVIVHHMNFDLFFFSHVKDHLDSLDSDIQNSNHHSNFINNVSHIYKGEANTRIKSLLDQKIDAAVFMGFELENLQQIFYEEDLIPVLNLNRCICNLYSIPFFPRAVFVTKKEVWEEHQIPITYYLDLYSDVAVNIYTKDHKKRNFRQFPCRTGRKANISEIKVLLEFSRDINMMPKEEHPYERIGISNFAFDVIYKKWEKIKRFASDLRKADTKNVCGVTEGRKYEKVKKGMNIICDEIEDLVKEKGPECRIEDIFEYIDKSQNLESDSKAAFKEWVKENFE